MIKTPEELRVLRYTNKISSEAHKEVISFINNRPFSYSKTESESKDISLHFVEFSNVHITDRSSNATQSNLVYKYV